MEVSQGPHPIHDRQCRAPPGIRPRSHSASGSPLHRLTAVPLPRKRERIDVARKVASTILLPPAGEGAGRRKGGAANPTQINALPEIFSQLIPAPQPHAILFSSRAPKRDHDEWLVRGRLGGPGVVPGQAESTSAWASSLAKPLQTHGVLDVGHSSEARLRTYAAGEGGDAVDSRSTATHAFRDVARDAPGSRYHKPKTPIGRRGESLICFAD